MFTELFSESESKQPFFSNVPELLGSPLRNLPPSRVPASWLWPLSCPILTFKSLPTVPRGISEQCHCSIVALGKVALVTKALMTGGNRFQSKLATTASTLLLIIKRKTCLGYIYLCSNRLQEPSVHKPMHWTLISFLASCWTPVPPPSSHRWVWRRKQNKLTQIEPLWSNTLSSPALHPPKCFPVPYPSHCTLLHNKFKACALFDPTSPKFSSSSARAFPLAEYTPKIPQKANITATTPLVLFHGPLQTLAALSTDQFPKDSSGGRRVCRGGTVKPIQH